MYSGGRFGARACLQGEASFASQGSSKLPNAQMTIVIAQSVYKVRRRWEERNLSLE
jgi:hypothetical protein